MASLTDVIITMNEEDYNRALTFNIDKVYKFNGAVAYTHLDVYKRQQLYIV